MSLVSRAVENRRSVVSGGVVAVFGLGLAGLALWYDGEATADVDLNDSGVWVTRSAEGELGRFNYEAQAMDGKLLANSVSFDVDQDASRVLLESAGDATASPVDPAQLTLQSTMNLPAGAQVASGGASVAVYDEKSGGVWVLPFDGAMSFDAEEMEPVVDAGSGAVVEVGTTGTVAVASPENDALYTITTGTQGSVEETEESSLSVTDGAELQVTTVGDEAVVLDRSTGGVVLPGGDEVEIDGGAEAQLQQPSPDSDFVALATSSGMVTQPLDGGAPTKRAAGGTPASPVQLGECLYGAWSVSGQVVRDCPGTDADQDMVLEGLQDTTKLVYRVNRDVIVLNDAVNGAMWMAADEFQKVEDWDLTMPDNDEGEKTEAEDSTPEQVDQFVADREKKNKPPRAKDDTLGVRPGGTTVLNVIGNDVDPDGDVMAATVDAGPEGDVTVDRVLDGAALQADVPKDAHGSETFTYRVDDGRGGEDTGQVTLDVVPPDENNAPVQPGEPVLKVGQDGSSTIKVLPYFQDPDGDDLFLSHAGTADPADEVRFRPDGTVEFRDGGSATGRKIVDLTVADSGGATFKGRLLVDVTATNEPPVAVQDHVTVLAGQPLTVEPLTNDSDPNGDPVRLVHVAKSDGLTVTNNLAAKVFTVQGEEPGSYDLTYQISDGPNSTMGLVRVDVVDPPEDDSPPVAVSDEVLLPSGGSALVDVLANDTDPAGGVLVAQSVDVPDDASVDVDVLNHEILKVTETQSFTDPVTFEYTVANGSGASTGQVRVVPIPAPEELRPPEAGADEATVHTGDVVTIPVLDNDSHPDGLDLTLNDELQEEPDAALGEAFVAQDVIRFKAGSQAGTAHLVYEVEDDNGQKDSAQVKVTVNAAEENTAPQVPDVEARVLSGKTVRVPVPLDGVDPDGDHVSITGIAQAPSQGTARIVDGYVDYEAADDASGFDTLAYEVTDTRGAVGRGVVRVGVAVQSETNQPPQAVDDETTVRPGRDVAVRALENDSDPDGDQIGLVGKGFEGVPDGVGVRAVKEDVVVSAPDTKGAYSFYYGVQDSFKARATGGLTVNVDPEAPLLRPVANDDVVTNEQARGSSSVTVDVLANDVDPDGVGADLDVSVDDSQAGVTVGEDGRIETRLTQDPQVITYTVTDVDGLEAKAFLRVPGDQAKPYIDPDKIPVEATGAEPLTLDLKDLVEVRHRHEPRITTEDTVSSTEGEAVVEDGSTLEFTAPKDYAGAASVSFEVTDGDDPEDPEGLTSVLTLPIDVVPSDNTPPKIVGSPGLEVAAGEESAVDLSRFVEDVDKDDLTFEVEASEGVSTSVSGATVTAQADPSVPKGTTTDVPFTVSDGTNPPVSGSLRLEVTASNRPLVKTTDDTVQDAHQGEQIRVPVLENDTNPFPGEDLTVVGAFGESGSGQVDFDGSNVLVTPAEDFTGVLTARYTVADATGDEARKVDGRVKVVVVGKPDAPSAPAVEEVRSETVVLSWDQPNDNGAEITGYTLRTNDGKSADCTTTTCTFDGLTNDVEYTFTVAATNAVGESERSPASKPARPDEKPDPPAAPELAFGDRELSVKWKNATYTDRSAIQCVNLEISPAPADGKIQKDCVTGTSTTWEGLTNGTAYTVRVQAKNSAPDPSDWSEPSAPEVPAGPPRQPAAPAATRVDTALGGQTTVTWKQPDTNGADIQMYLLDVLQGGETVDTVKAGTNLSQTVEDLNPRKTYRFAVRAKNKAGTSPQSDPSNAVVPYGTPKTPTGVDAKLGSTTSGRATVSWTATTAARGPGLYYQVRANGSGTKNAGDTTSYTYTGLSNGTSYTFQVRACNEFTCSGWSGESGSVKPYTTPGAPSVSWNPTKDSDGHVNDGTFSLRPGSSGGRAVTKITYSIDGSGSKSGTKTSFPTSVGVGAGYDKSYTLTARACNAAGCGPAEKVSGSTYSPNPQAWVTRGTKSGVTDKCTTGNCYWYKVTYRDFYPKKNRQVSCWSHDNPESPNAGWHDISSPDRSFTKYMGGDGTFQMTDQCLLGYDNIRVAVKIDGKLYQERTWNMP